MKKLLNTIYNTKEHRYLSLDGLNIVVLEDNKEIARIPLHNAEEIITVGYTGISPALMGACAENNISVCFLKPDGRFLSRSIGKTKGNVILTNKGSPPPLRRSVLTFSFSGECKAHPTRRWGCP